MGPRGPRSGVARAWVRQAVPVCLAARREPPPGRVEVLAHRVRPSLGDRSSFGSTACPTPGCACAPNRAWYHTYGKRVSRLNRARCAPHLELGGMRLHISYSDEPGLSQATLSHDVHMLCDVCGEANTQDQPGLFQYSDGGLPPKEVELRAVHKGACDDVPQATWGEIGQVLGNLLRGLGYRGQVYSPEN